MRTAHELLTELERRGVRLDARAGRLRFRPVAAVDALLLGEIAAAKGELIALLGAAGGSKNRETPSPGTDKTAKSRLARTHVSDVSSSQGLSDDFAPRAGDREAPLLGEKPGLPGTARTDRAHALPDRVGSQVGVPPTVDEVGQAPRIGFEYVVGSGYLSPRAARAFLRASVPFFEDTSRCYACGGTRSWRLREGTPWTCARCHPPQRAESEVEWRDGEHRRDPFDWSHTPESRSVVESRAREGGPASE